MNLHNEIMNIPVDNRKHLDAVSGAGAAAYKFGHRDARHAAAELSLKAEARIEELEEALQKAREDINWMLNSGKFLSNFVFDYIDKALENKQ